jgi:quinol monooxygenase YgiN
MPFTVAATLRIKKKHLAEFTKLVKRHAQNTMTKEPGCISFEVSIDRDDPRRFLFYEVYVTEADFDHHMETPWMKRQMAKTAHMVDGAVEMVGFCNRLAAPNK